MAKERDLINSRLTPHLTEREREVLQWTVAGLTDKEIAAKLGIESKTVNTHQEHLREKLNVENRTQMAAVAMQMGLATAIESSLSRSESKVGGATGFTAIRDLNPDEFERQAGASRDDFMTMIKELADMNEKNNRHRKLSLEDQLLLTLHYSQRRGTLAELSQNFGVSEATAWRIIQKVKTNHSS